VPIYEYVCTACGHQLEVIHGVNDPGPGVCPNCGAEGQLKKAFAPPAIVFRGTGWAKKDRASASSKGSSKSDADGGSKESGSGAKPAATSAGGDAD
jgi:putative FmdB family regulatory protein